MEHSYSQISRAQAKGEVDLHNNILSPSIMMVTPPNSPLVFAAEMTEAVGLSHLYPAVPIMSFFAMVLLLILIPGFWKTRIVALVALVSWLFVGNLGHFIGMIHWRGHTNDAPVFALILSALRWAWNCGYWTSLACFAHFIWQRLQPLPVRLLYDTRRRNNVIHLFFTLVLPLLWTPLIIVSCPFRYAIMEDFGPLGYGRDDWPGFVVVRLPPLLGSMTVGIFSVLALVNYWRMKREDIDPDILKPHSSVRTRKLLLIAFINIPLAIFAVYRQIIRGLHFEWATPTPLAENIASLQTVARGSSSSIFQPLLAFYVFAWFGLGAEARKAYRAALLKLGDLITVTLREHWPRVNTPPLSSIALWKAKLQQGLADDLSLIQPNAQQITSFSFTVPREDDLQVPASPRGIQPSKPVGDRTDIKRRGTVPSREPAPRLSIQKPPLAALNPENAIPPVADVPLRRLSHHKPPFIPLAPTNALAIVTPNASGSILPREGTANNIGQQGGLAPRPDANRLPYKSAFVPLAPANAVPDASRPAIPLVEIARDIMGEKNYVLQAGNVVEDGMAPPPLSSVSPSRAPPPFASPSTATPAPPYQEVDPFLQCAP